MIIIKAVIAADNRGIIDAIKLAVKIDNSTARKYLLGCIEDYYNAAKLNNLNIDGYPLRAKLHKLNAVTFEVIRNRFESSK